MGCHLMLLTCTNSITIYMFVCDTELCDRILLMLLLITSGLRNVQKCAKCTGKKCKTQKSVFFSKVT